MKIALVAAVLLPVGVVSADPLITPDAQLVSVHSAAKFFEGPTWNPIDERLYFSALTPASELLQLTPPAGVVQWMANAQGINGTFLSTDARLVACQGDTRRVLSLGIGTAGPTDTVILAEDPAWNGPNDICVAPNGDIYFTTPDYIGGGQTRVHHLSPAGVTTTVVTDMTQPNGVITSLDGTVLYVSDSVEKHWRSYPINPDGTVGAGSVFFDPAVSDMSDPDGMSIDELGNLYLCGRGGVFIVSPAGQQLEMMPVPQFNTNVTFGGVDGRTLYITCDGRVYSLSMEVRGAMWSSESGPNQLPVVDAGSDTLVTTLTQQVPLDGTVTDDGLPDPPGAPVTKWFQRSGPGSATFGDAMSVDATVSFSAVGDYTLELMAFDGLRVVTDQVAIEYRQVGDFDGDKDVDIDDTNHFISCFTGSELGPPGPGCELTDIDGDSDTDMDDFGPFQRCLSGSGGAADPDCAD